MPMLQIYSLKGFEFSETDSLKIYIVHTTKSKENTERFSHGWMAKVLNCEIVENDFELQSRYYDHLQLLLWKKLWKPAPVDLQWQHWH